jgi:hypothetical protein
MTDTRETFEPVTLGHIRSHGRRDLLTYCESGRYHHSAVLDHPRLAARRNDGEVAMSSVQRAAGLVTAYEPATTIGGIPTMHTSLRWASCSAPVGPQCADGPAGRTGEVLLRPIAVVMVQ